MKEAFFTPFPFFFLSLKLAPGMSRIGGRNFPAKGFYSFQSFFPFPMQRRGMGEILGRKKALGARHP